MYATLLTTLTDGTTGLLTLLAGAVQTQFLAILPIAIPVVGGIAIAFFSVKVVRGLIHV